VVQHRHKETRILIGSRLNCLAVVRVQYQREQWAIISTTIGSQVTETCISFLILSIHPAHCLEFNACTARGGTDRMSVGARRQCRRFRRLFTVRSPQVTARVTSGDLHVGHSCFAPGAGRQIKPLCSATPPVTLCFLLAVFG
jgi:hypothetical protein